MDSANDTLQHRLGQMCHMCYKIGMFPLLQQLTRTSVANLHQFVVKTPAVLPDLTSYFNEVHQLVQGKPGPNKRAYARLLSIRRTLLVAATTERQCRLVAAMVRAIRRWLSAEPMSESDVGTRREVLAATIDEAHSGFLKST